MYGRLEIDKLTLRGNVNSDVQLNTNLISIKTVIF